MCVMSIYAVKRSDNNSEKANLLRNQLVTLGDLQDFKVQLLKEIKQLMSGTSDNPLRPWLKSGEVRKLLKISSGTLQTLRSNGTLSFNKVGGTIYYQYDDIQKMIENSEK